MREERWMSRLLSLVLVAIMALAVVACGNDDGDGNGERQLQSVTVGYIPIFIFAPIFVAIDEGYFADEGIEVRLERLAGGADMLVQTAAGNFDVGAGGVGVAMFNLVGDATRQNLEIPIEVVAPLHEERPPATTPLTVSKRRFDAGEITSVADLAGKRVAINARGAATEYWLELALRSGGLTMSDIELVTVPFPDVPTALDNGSIDGAMLGEPIATLGADQGLVHVLVDDFVNGQQPTAVFWNRSWAERNPELGDGFLRAYLRAVERLEDGGWEDPAILGILEGYTDVPVSVLERAARPFNSREGILDIDGFRAQEAFFREQGLLTYEGELDFATFMRLP
jgi:NitT/TauT family transport system substrate-binding protein